ncbi:kinase-like protein [Hypoxylon crocopeplum]|nr:kinase-like protein [Hypoxylon crocopeplum]
MAVSCNLYPETATSCNPDLEVADFSDMGGKGEVGEHREPGEIEATKTPMMDFTESPRYRRPSYHTGGIHSVESLEDMGMQLEELEYYQPGGFHPVHIGDVLDGRYEVTHKLGSGGFATVWLCQDTISKCWKAVKIIIAQKSSERCPELELKDTLGDSNLIALPEQHFWIDGPNGRHLALVLPILGPAACKTRDLVSDTDAIHKVCRQLAEALHYIHSKGICHGDFRPSNILHRMYSIDSLTKEQIWEVVGWPFSSEHYFKVSTIAGGNPHPNAPRYAIRSADLRRFQDWIINDEIAIIDFGVAFKVSNPCKNVGVPISHSAPELLFEGHPTLCSDIWSLACSILQLQGGDGFRNTTPCAVGDMEFFLGPLPEEYRQSYKRQFPPPDEKEDDESGDETDYGEFDRDECWPMIPIDEKSAESYLVWKNRELQEKRKMMQKSCGYSNLLNAELGREKQLGGFGSLERQDYRMSRFEVLQLSDLLRKMFRYEPEQRLSAADVLNHPWLNPAK